MEGERAYLLDNVISRQYYDPSNQEHRDALMYFLRTGKWLLHFRNEKIKNLPYALMLKTLEHFDRQVSND